MHDKLLETVDENSNILHSSIQNHNQTDAYLSSETRIFNAYDQHMIPNSFIIKMEPLLDDHEKYLIDGDSIEQMTIDDINSSMLNQNPSLTIRSTQLDAIVEDSNEENSDDLDEMIQPIK
jgi:hypothetical protein